MKNAVIILGLCLWFAKAYAQNDVQSQKFIREVVPDFVKENRTVDIIYSDRLWDITDIKKKLDVDTLQSRIWRGTYGNDPNTKIILTQDERAYIKGELNKMAAFKWEPGLLDNSKMISQDTIESVFKNRSKGWPYFYNHYGSGFYGFMKPIFIRNNSVCLFYRDHSACDLCGSGELAVYILKNGKWKKLIMLYGWIS